jgi:hypothetical protein
MAFLKSLGGRTKLKAENASVEIAKRPEKAASGYACNFNLTRA